MIGQTVVKLIDPQSKDLAFTVYTFEDGSNFNSLSNYNCFSIILITKGSGTVISDMSTYSFPENSLLCFSLYQPFEVKSEGVLCGIAIHFHPDFFCLHKHRNEVSCNGILFNNIYHSLVTNLDDTEMQSLVTIANELKSEIQNAELAQYELLISYLKIFLINASRIKIKQEQIEELKAEKEPFISNALKDAVEQHFKTMHSSGDYANLLNTSTQILNRASKTYFNKTFSNLIADRLIIEIKRELYLTAKPIKQIAYDLNFNDEFYFSRFFKSKVAVSPQTYRETIGFDRADA